MRYDDHDTDSVNCRFEPHASFADMYAQAGPNYPMLADEKWVADVPLAFLRENGVRIKDGAARIPLSLFKDICNQAAQGWLDEE